MKEKFIIYPDTETKPEVDKDQKAIALKIEDYLLIDVLRRIERNLRNAIRN